MTYLSTFFLILSILLFLVGAVVFVRFFTTRKQLVYCITVVFDVNDSTAFYTIMNNLTGYQIVDSAYKENDDCAYIRLVVSTRYYKPLYKSLKQIQNVEVL